MTAIINRGIQFIQHGDNVITLASAHPNTSYTGEVTIKLASMGGVTTRGLWHNTNPMTPTVIVDTTTRFKVRFHGGFGFTSCGSITPGTVGTGITERFDDIANTQTGRTNATARTGSPGGYSLNGFGFTSCGSWDYGNNPVGTTERFDDVINSWTGRTDATVKGFLCGYSLNGFGFTSCGNDGITERFDDVANTHTGRTPATSRAQPSSFGLNNFGFTCRGNDSGIIEKFDDIANTQTSRTSDILSSGAPFLGSFNGYGFNSCGGGVLIATTRKFDDVANTWSSRADNPLARQLHAGYCLNGFGFTSCGDKGGSFTGDTERFDDIANTWTNRTSATTRREPSGFSTNEYFVQYMTLNA